MIVALTIDDLRRLVRLDSETGKVYWLTRPVEFFRANRQKTAEQLVPFATEVVAVDLLPDATPLPAFKHPHRALYVFGPEDGTLGRRITERAQHKVFVPMRNCLNLNIAVNVILYDRLLKGGEFGAAMEGMSPATKAAIYGRHLNPDQKRKSA